MSVQMKFRWEVGLIAGICLLAGCSNGTEVTLAKVPPVTQTAAPPEKKPNSRIPKNARFSPPAPTNESN